MNDKSTSEINYEDSADSGFEPYIEEKISNKSLEKNQSDRFVLVD